MMVLVYAQSKDRRTLADKLVAYSDLPRQEAENLASSAGPGPYTPLPLMDLSAILRDLPEETQRTFRHRSLMLEKAIRWAYPLAIDEELLEDGLLTTCLSEAAIEYPRGTVAVQRKTNLGEIVFLDQEFTFDIDSKELIDNRPDSSPEVLAGAKAEEFASGWATLGLDIAKALLGAIAGKIGSAIFARFFPPGVPPYFEQVYQEFRKIVKQEIEENTIRLLVGEVGAVQSHMSAYAQHRRAGNNDAAEQDITQAWNRSVLVTSKLLQFPVAGLGPFLTAGGLHLAIMQERALRDPTVNDPNHSSWANIYVERAGAFISYVGSQPDKIVGERAAQITPVGFTERWRNTPQGPIEASFWWWEDRGLGIRRTYAKRRGCCDPNPEPTARAHREAHYRSVIDTLTKALDPARDTARHWRVARETPLPQVET
ncbi:MAG: hypothetical protein ABW208_11295 [Pyrinomonadaceae bacterium]